MKTAIRTRDLRKAFRTGDLVTPVLKGIDLDIPAGELFFIVGPSGCGKTTLISVLCGTLHADAGDLEVLGHDLRNLSEAQVTQFRAHHVGFVFQQFNLIPTLTVVENVSVPLRLQGRNVREARRAAAAMLERVGLADKIDERPARLSGGQQQRVAIARALVHQPALIVCDEPTSALDSKTGHQVMELLTPQPGDSPRTVIVVTHDPRVYHFADRIAEMEDGTVRRTLSRSEAAAAFGFFPTAQPVAS
jgi:putative ABC transport system ATP-binding protein